MKLLPKRPLLLALALALLALSWPAAGHAQSADDNEDVLIRINGDAHVDKGSSIDTVVVISGDAIVDGTVRHNVVVIHGNAVVTGSVGRNLTVIDGDIDLRQGSQVKNVRSVRGDLTRDAGATVTGKINERDNWRISGAGLALFSIWFWAAATVIAIVGGLVFAAVGGRQLTRAAYVMTGQIVNTIVGGVFLWIALPILAVIIMLTVVGILLGIAVFVFLLPAIGFLGYLVAGTRVGLAILNRGDRAPGEHPYAAAALGIFILQVFLIIPAVGFVIAFIAGLWGGAALAFTAFTAAGGRSFESPRPAPPATV